MFEGAIHFIFEKLTSAEFWKVAAPIMANVTLVAINFVITGGTFVSRRNEERRFQSLVYLYQSLVVDKVCDFLNAASKAVTVFQDAKQSVSSQTNTGLNHKIVVAGCENLDKLNQELTSSLLNPTRCVSNDTFSRLNNTWEVFYDSVTDCTSKLSGPLTPQLEKQVNMSIREAHDLFINELGNSIRESHPSREEKPHTGKK